MRFEILDDEGGVINTIIASQEFVDQHYPGQYREVAEPDALAPQNAVITKFAFLKRFTADERKTISAAAKLNLDVEDFKLLLDAAQDVDLAHPDTVSGVTALEAGGLLGAGRAAKILQP